MNHELLHAFGTWCEANKARLARAGLELELHVDAPESTRSAVIRGTMHVARATVSAAGSADFDIIDAAEASSLWSDRVDGLDVARLGAALSNFLEHLEQA